MELWPQGPTGDGGDLRRGAGHSALGMAFGGAAARGTPVLISVIQTEAKLLKLIKEI